MIKELKACEISVNGLVQGVGFRPFIYRIAKIYDLTGWVENRNDCVKIKVQGNFEKIRDFIAAIKKDTPRLARIESLVYKDVAIENFQGFKVAVKDNITDKSTLISPDVSVCGECLNDIKTPSNRLNYPFVNCTNCGPRFSLIKATPYDRENTTMREFLMCDKCRKEYEDPMDRRFHAQPNACSNCGPQYLLVHKSREIEGIDSIINVVCALIKEGNIIAIKGIGGFHLACDAKNEEAVKKLRTRKNREGKPFAVLMPDIDIVRNYAHLNEHEEQWLLSYQRPIVLLKIKRELAPSVSVGLNRIGIMLPYTPLHYLIFANSLFESLVLTSGNVTDNPIVISNNQVQKELIQIADAFLLHNREIHNRNDDSVSVVVNSTPRLMRRSRGFAPEPILLKFKCDGIIAAGAEQKNCFCIGKGNQAILSQHIGDLMNIESFEFYKESILKFQRLFRFRPELIAHDLHPDYLSTKYAIESCLKTVPVQHHHAHIASCMAEHGLDEKVIGVSLDGTGLGDDNNIWGGEFLLCDFAQYERYTYFDYVPMQGGNKSVEEPWRMAVSYLYKTDNKNFVNMKLPFREGIPNDKVDLLISAIDNNINTVLTSSAGRLFDAVSALMNVCLISSYEAEAAMRLECLIDENEKGRYPYEINKTIMVAEVIKNIVNDLTSGVKNRTIATKFHNTIIAIIVDVIKRMSNISKINVVVLSGGLFQNRYILENLENILEKKGFKIFTHKRIPTNDGGIALGQLAIAAKRRNLQCV